MNVQTGGKDNGEWCGMKVMEGRDDGSEGDEGSVGEVNTNEWTLRQLGHGWSQKWPGPEPASGLSPGVDWRDAAER